MPSFYSYQEGRDQEDHPINYEHSYGRTSSPSPILSSSPPFVPSSSLLSSSCGTHTHTHPQPMHLNDTAPPPPHNTNKTINKKHNNNDTTRHQQMRQQHVGEWILQLQTVQYANLDLHGEDALVLCSTCQLQVVDQSIILTSRHLRPEHSTPGPLFIRHLICAQPHHLTHLRDIRSIPGFECLGSIQQEYVLTEILKIQARGIHTDILAALRGVHYPSDVSEQFHLPSSQHQQHQHHHHYEHPSSSQMIDVSQVHPSPTFQKRIVRQIEVPSSLLLQEMIELPATKKNMSMVPPTRVTPPSSPQRVDELSTFDRSIGDSSSSPSSSSSSSSASSLSSKRGASSLSVRLPKTMIPQEVTSPPIDDRTLPSNGRCSSNFATTSPTSNIQKRIRTKSLRAQEAEFNRSQQNGFDEDEERMSVDEDLNEDDDEAIGVTRTRVDGSDDEDSGSNASSSGQLHRITAGGKRRPIRAVAAAEERKRKRAKKDPNAPKRPTSNYMFWCATRRPALRAMNPDLPSNILMQKIALEWKSADFSTAERQFWMDMQERDQARYKRQMEQWKATGTYVEEPPIGGPYEPVGKLTTQTPDDKTNNIIQSSPTSSSSSSYTYPSASSSPSLSDSHDHSGSLASSSSSSSSIDSTMSAVSSSTFISDVDLPDSSIGILTGEDFFMH